MSKVIRAIVNNGRYQGEAVKITNVSEDDMGRRFAACIFSDGRRANIAVSDLELIKDQPEPTPEIRKPKTASMPFISGSTSSRTMTHTKNMERPRPETKSPTASKKTTLATCEICGIEYNIEDRKGRPGKLGECENCALETEEKVEGKMIFSHKTGATIEIKKDGELRYEADTFDPKNKIS